MSKAIKNLTVAELEAELAKSDINIEKIKELIAPYQKRLESAYSRRKSLKSAMAQAKANDIGYVIDHVDDSTYDQWQAMLPKQTYSYGYWTDTMQLAFKLMFNYNDEPSQELIDFILRYEAVAKRMRMGIFRHDCSRDGSWIVEKIDDEWVIYNSTSYSYCYQKQFEFKTKELVIMLRYVSENHYYSGPVKEDNEDDDEY